MAITIPTAASIGAFSEDVAADAAEQGNYGPRIANALLVLAAEATADIAAVEGGGGGYPTRRAKFVTPGSSNPEALLATTATNGTQVVHSLTLSGSYARSLRISVMSGTIGNVTVSGINPAGGTHSEVVAADSSGFTLKVYGPGAVTVTIPNTASGTYRIGTWEWLGLTADQPAADMDDAGNGISIQTLANGAPQQTDGFVDVGVIRAPSIAGGFGAWRPSALGTFGLDGVTTFTVAYLGAAS